MLTLLCSGCGTVVAVAAMINLNALREGLLDRQPLVVTIPGRLIAGAVEICAATVFG